MSAKNFSRRGKATDSHIHAKNRPAPPSISSQPSSSVTGVSDDKGTPPLSAMVGKLVTISTKKGVKVEGTLAGNPGVSSALVVLHHAQVIDGDVSLLSRADRSKNGRSNGKTDDLVIPVAEVVSVVPKATANSGVSAQSDSQGPRSIAAPPAQRPLSDPHPCGDGFLVDTDISFGSYANTGPGRQLQPFKDFNQDGNDTWDQFEDNKRLFGITTTFNEHDYTTKIDKKDPKYSERMAEAERIAAEIEGRESSNPHVREERGLTPRDDDGDEEDRYSGVRRPSRPKSSLGTSDSGPKLSYAAAAAAAASAGGRNSVQLSLKNDSTTARTPRSDQNIVPVPASSGPAAGAPKSAPSEIKSSVGQSELSTQIRPSTTLRSSPASIRKSGENVTQSVSQSHLGRSSTTSNRDSFSVKANSTTKLPHATGRNLSSEADLPSNKPVEEKPFETPKKEIEMEPDLDERKKSSELFKISNSVTGSKIEKSQKEVAGPSSSAKAALVSVHGTELVPSAEATPVDDTGTPDPPSSSTPATVSSPTPFVTPHTEHVIGDVKNPSQNSANHINDSAAPENASTNELKASPDTSVVKPRKSIRSFKLNPDAQPFSYIQDAPAAQTEQLPSIVAPMSPALEHTNHYQAPALQGAQGHDMNMYMYLHDPTMGGAAAGLPLGYAPGPYRSGNFVNYGMSPSHAISPTVAPTVVHPGAIPLGYPGMPRQPYTVPYQPSLGSVPQNRSFAPAAQPYGLPVPSSVLPAQPQNPNAFIAGGAYGFPPGHSGMTPHAMHSVPPGMVHHAPPYYSPGPSVGPRGGSGGRNRRGGRGGQQRHSHGQMHHGQVTVLGVQNEMDASPVNLGREVSGFPVQDSPN